MTSNEKVKLNPSTAQEWYEAGVLAFKAKNHDIALRFIAQAITASPEVSLYHAFIGMIFVQIGQHKEAIKAYKKAIELDPLNLEANHNLASLYLELGHPVKSEPYFLKALEIDPQNVQVLNALGILYLSADDKRKAQRHFKKALELDPEFKATYLHLGDLHISLHQPKKALHWYNRYLENETCTPELFFKKAEAQLALGNLKRSKQLCIKGLAEAPKNATGNAILGQCLERLGDFENARIAYSHVEEAELNKTAQAQCSLGRIYFEQVKDLAKAKQHFMKAVELSPAFIIARIQLANVHVIQGEIEEANRHLNHILKISPDHPYAMRQLAHIKKADSYESMSVQELESKLETSSSNEHIQAELRFALADILDQKEEYAHAFEHLKQANEIKAKNSSFSYEMLQKQFQEAKNYFSPEKIDQLRLNGHGSQCPVFIVGMPRSGTTLTEQILSSHPAVFGAGELQDISQLKANIQKETRQNFPECLDQLSDDQFYQFAESHIQRLNSLSPSTARVIDKMPFNYYFVGLILSLFPNAKIIHCQRNPMDTCLSNYFLKFADRMSFAYNLKHLGQVFQIHDQYMNFWKELLPESIHTQSYESLIHDTETETRKMLDFLELDWNDACMAHQENKRPVRTASNWQVRQPIYKSSVGRWKNYRDQLKPLAEALNFNLDQA